MILMTIIILGLHVEKEMARKRALWHKFCSCTCNFCDPEGCNHGKNPDDGACNRFTCKRCKDVRCTVDCSNSYTIWSYPTQVKRPGGGLYWHDQLYRGTRQNLVDFTRKEMEFFVTHHEHTKLHKQQVWDLLENLPDNAIILKSDFIQNIVHNRGVETTQVRTLKKI